MLRTLIFYCRSVPVSAVSSSSVLLVVLLCYFHLVYRLLFHVREESNRILFWSKHVIFILSVHLPLSLIISRDQYRRSSFQEPEFSLCHITHPQHPPEPPQFYHCLPSQTSYLIPLTVKTDCISATCWNGYKQPCTVLTAYILPDPRFFNKYRYCLYTFNQLAFPAHYQTGLQNGHGLVVTDSQFILGQHFQRRFWKGGMSDGTPISTVTMTSVFLTNSLHAAKSILASF